MTPTHLEQMALEFIRGVGKSWLDDYAEENGEQYRDVVESWQRLVAAADEPGPGEVR